MPNYYSVSSIRKRGEVLAVMEALQKLDAYKIFLHRREEVIRTKVSRTKHPSLHRARHHYSVIAKSLHTKPSTMSTSGALVVSRSPSSCTFRTSLLLTATQSHATKPILASTLHTTSTSLQAPPNRSRRPAVALNKPSTASTTSIKPVESAYWWCYSTLVRHISLLPQRALIVSDCASSSGDVEANIRADIRVLRTSPYVRNEMPIIGYVLDVEASQLREVKYVQSLSIVQSPVMPLVWHSVGGSPPSQ
jgi:hypothetical protein